MPRSTKNKSPDDLLFRNNSPTSDKLKLGDLKGKGQGMKGNHTKYKSVTKTSDSKN